MKTMIRISDLRKSFSGKEILKGVNLAIEAGESLVILGGSGAGKSVLMKHIIGLLKPDSGSLVIDGHDVTKFGEQQWMNLRRRFGMLFQGAALFDSMSVGENVAFPLRRHTRLSDSEIAVKVREKLALVGLKNVEDIRPVSLSGGMRKRVGLARALAMEPDIILYDEPTTGLDPIMGDVINRLIIKMRNNLAVTSVTISHDIKSSYLVADRIAVLYDGRIIQVDSPVGIRNSRVYQVQYFLHGGKLTRQEFETMQFRDEE